MYKPKTPVSSSKSIGFSPSPANKRKTPSNKNTAVSPKQRVQNIEGRSIDRKSNPGPAKKGPPKNI